MRRATHINRIGVAANLISIHALHEESDRPELCARYAQIREFQSTLSMRRATFHQGWKFGHVEFQSTLSMRRATASQFYCLHVPHQISIHALHEESDTRGLVCCRVPGISIHALHEESDFQGRRTLLPRAISIHALHEESDVPTCAR